VGKVYVRMSCVLSWGEGEVVVRIRRGRIDVHLWRVVGVVREMGGKVKMAIFGSSDTICLFDFRYA
jgi:hypothetical protein